MSITSDAAVYLTVWLQNICSTFIVSIGRAAGHALLIRGGSAVIIAIFHHEDISLMESQPEWTTIICEEVLIDFLNGEHISRRLSITVKLRDSFFLVIKGLLFLFKPVDICITEEYWRLVSCSI